MHEQKPTSNSVAAKAVNLPAWNKLTVDIEHIASGHMVGGSRLALNSTKDLFPTWMTKDQVVWAIEAAYKGAKRVGTQGVDRVALEGLADGLVIKMYVNLTTMKIETAFPQARGNK